MSYYKKIAAIVAASFVIAAVVPAIAIAAPKFQDVVVRNTDAEPVPVSEPLWQGTPYVSTRVLLGAGCDPFAEIPAGQILFVERVTASFNVAPDHSASAALGYTPPGGAASDFIYVPSHPSGSVHQSFGVYDGFQGSVDVGLPTTTTPEACYFATAADDVRGRLIITGYLVPAG